MAEMSDTNDHIVARFKVVIERYEKMWEKYHSIKRKQG